MNGEKTMEKLNVLVTFPVKEEKRHAIEAAAPDAAYTYLAGYFVGDEKITLTREHMEKADVILGCVPPDMLQYCRGLKFLQLDSAGVKPYIGGVLPEGAALACATGAYGLAISECMLTGMLMLQKKMIPYMDNQKKHLWKKEGMVKSVAASTVLCVGMGDIGREFLKRCKALGAYTIGVKRTGGTRPEWLDELYTIEEVDQLLPRADVLALILPETSKTYHMFDAERLSRLRADAIVLNTGRGNTVDNLALAKMLTEGRLAGACLDVFDPEPLPEDHPLWETPNTIITPHVTGGFTLQYTLDQIADISAENFRRFCDRQPLVNEVDFEEGYAKNRKTM